MVRPAVTLRLRRFRHRFGIAAPRVLVRSHVDWRWYAAAVCGVVFLLVALVWGVARRGDVADLELELAGLRQRIASLDDELGRLRASAGTEQSVQQMDRGAVRQLSTRIKLLESENGALKEDIAFFDKLVPADSVESSVRIERVRLTPEVEPGRYRFRLLVGFQPSKQVKEFRGRLQLRIIAERAGEDVVLNFPGAKDQQADYLVEVRHFARKEGVVVLPAGVKVKSVEAFLIQNGSVKSQSVAEL